MKDPFILKKCSLPNFSGDRGKMRPQERERLRDGEIRRKSEKRQGYF